MADGDLTLNDNPNVDTGYVESGGKLHQVHLTRQLNGTLELNDDNYNVDTGYVTVNGKKHRVHLVAVLGNGGGSIDYTTVVSKTTTMPVADSSNADIVYMYTGETDGTYTHGAIYENIATTTPSSATATQSVGSSLSDIAVDVDTLEAFTGWTTDNSLQIFYTADGWSVDTTSLGITYTGTPTVGDAITITYTAETTSYAWQKVDTGGSQVITISDSTLTQELANDTIYDCGELTALTITVPATMDAKYISQVNFTSGTTPTALTAPNTIKWKGDDLTGGVFVPVASKRYAVLFFTDGVNVRGIVQAVA